MKRILALLVLSAVAAFAQTPAVTQILNNYGLINAGTVAQGAIFIVKGSNLADQETTTLQSVPLQTALKNVQIRVTVNGVTTTAPLYYAFNFQLAGILPSTTPVGSGTLVVVNNGKQSAPAAINVIRSGFGMLTVNGAGTGIAAVHDQNYVLLSTTNSTNPGKAVVFYGSGVGPTTGNETVEQTGANASGDLTGIPITVTVGGKSAQVLYRGRTIYPGLDQINVVIPTLDTYNCEVAVQITTNGVAANAGTIPVAQTGSTCTPVNNGSGGGGGGSSINPTQSEVNGWISSGSYRAGSVTLGKVTTISADTLGTTWTTTTKSSFSGSFTRISGVDLNNLLNTFVTPNIGQCTVIPYGQLLQYANLTVTPLDAGTSLTSVGPPGTAVAAKSTAGGFISYDAGDLLATYVGAGRYTIAGPGGPNVGAFSANLDVGTPLVWTNTDAAKTITRSSGLPVTWTGGASGTIVTITGSSFALNGASISGSTFICLANRAAGQFTIPASVLNQLPPSSVIGGGGFSIVTRGTLSVGLSGNGVRVNASGLDYFTISDNTLTSITPQYQ